MGIIFVVGVVGVFTGHSTSEIAEWLPAIAICWGVLFILFVLWDYFEVRVTLEERRKAKEGKLTQ